MLNPYDIIAKKRDRNKLDKDEIDFFINNYVSGLIKDYQMSALLMAIYLNGMDIEETYYLTEAMKNSGKILDFEHEFDTVTVDKHSTGGVGDKVSLVVGPILASLGICVPKLSGRGLGHTGGTLDKLESIPGFRVNLNKEEIISTTKKCGIVISGQTESITPADKLMYSLRDVTATVGSIPLIASSIMSKKLAAGCKIIVIDIKCGSGAFMKEYKDAKLLAEYMIEIGKLAKKKVICEITNMNEPIGYTVGNNLEVIEAINTLNNNGPADFTKLCIELSKEAIIHAFNVDGNKATNLIKDSLENGKAFNKFREMVISQGGNVNYIDNINLFEKTKYTFEYKAKKSGYIYSMNSTEIGLASMELGAGRKLKEDDIDYSAGIILRTKCGDYVNKGDTLFTLFANDEIKFKKAIEYIDEGIVISREKPDKEELILGIIK